MKWTREIYELWREQWERENPSKTAPRFDEFTRIMDLLEITPAEIFGIDA